MPDKWGHLVLAQLEGVSLTEHMAEIQVLPEGFPQTLGDDGRPSCFGRALRLAKTEDVNGDFVSHLRGFIRTAEEITNQFLDRNDR